jgi:hypothetical protein
MMKSPMRVRTTLQAVQIAKGIGGTVTLHATPIAQAMRSSHLIRSQSPMQMHRTTMSPLTLAST